MKTFADLTASDRVVSHHGVTVVITRDGKLYRSIERPKLPSLLVPLFTLDEARQALVTGVQP